jgi:hypothetical protein
VQVRTEGVDEVGQQPVSSPYEALESCTTHEQVQTVETASDAPEPASVDEEIVQPVASEETAKEEVQPDEHDDDSDDTASVTSPLELPPSPDRTAESSDIGAEHSSLPSSYPARAAAHFGEYGSHRIRWAHAVNSRRRIRAAFGSNAHFLEADVCSGPVIVKEDSTHKSRSKDANKGSETTVRTASGEDVIMAHYPTELSSDLSFETFMSMVLRHNERVAQEVASHASAMAAAGGGQDRSSGPSSSPTNNRQRRPTPTAEEEATVFSRELDVELDQAAAQTSSLASCVGSRRDFNGSGRSFALTYKGVKLDFKRFDCVAPCIEHLRRIDAAKKLKGHLWLNADVFAGPGALLTPFDAKQFVRLCAENLPEAVLSLSWGASLLSTMKSYSEEMVDLMIELCMTPIVPRALRHTSSNGKLAPEEGNDGECDTTASSPLRVPSDGEMCFTPAAVCHHITFAVAVEYAQMSAVGLTKLLDAVPGSSLTLFSGYGSVGVSPTHVKELIDAYGTSRLFLDLKLSKAWRTCGVTKASCCVQ